MMGNPRKIENQPMRIMLIPALWTDCANYRTDVCLIGYTVRVIISDKQGGMHDEFN